MSRAMAFFLAGLAAGTLLLGGPLSPTARAEEAPATGQEELALPNELSLYALTLAGTPYRFGGDSPETGLDCSGFVGHVFREVAGLELPRSASAIARLGRKIGLEELKPGDLVFFNTLRRAFSHVGIYLGDNRFIHASSSKTGDVVISDLRDRYWARRFDGARRLELPNK